jgi:NAD-dependent dihydropyrimidine dehydrogenase PreA subunit/bacterioferritin-associated ferredoxin
MPKRVRMVAEIIPGNCTGCRLCVQVCPTVAIGMRERLPDEIGPGPMIAELEPQACYNAQTCLEICPDDAIVMRELEQPFDVGFDREAFERDPADRAAVKQLCRTAGYSTEIKICACTGTSTGEIAAAILAGAHTPEAVSRSTGARTGCVELCLQPILQLLAAAGHGNAPKTPKNGYQWYGLSATLWEHVQADGTFGQEIAETYPNYRMNQELIDMARLRRK